MNVSVTEFGVKPGVKENQTTGFQNALDQCFLSGGGEVSVPAGEYVTGALRVRSGTTFHLLENAVLIGSQNIADYDFLNREDDTEPLPDEFLPTVHKKEGCEEYVRRWHNALIHVYRAKNVSIIGEKGSLIDGGNVYNPNGEEHYRGPHCISVLESENIHLAGYTIKNSSNWAHCMWICKNLVCENIKVYGGHDGIDFFGSDNVKVRDCVFHTGDDCIAGFDNIDVEIENCELNSSCSAMRFAGTNVVVKNCDVYGPGEYICRNSLSLEEKKRGANADAAKTDQYRNNMLSFMTYYADYRRDVREEPSNILITDCHVKNCDRFLHFNYSGNEIWQKQTPLREITFRNIDAENVKMPLNLYGDKEKPVTLTMENCKIDFCKDDRENPIVNAANFERITLNNVTCNNEYAALIDCYGETAGEVNVTGGNISERFEKEIQYKTDFKTQAI